ncbi:SusD/RagB family nutrient-binding outer membrane lipoprotein [Sphingobacterium suaedae]|uniref:SusD/RagB family nutrient-binding outer membrane lipoprotein n=1 Tax=Sphingobacterium suaedae TaxID=1686402 RepID=A0ABW5KIM8_9SPHI
MNFFNIKSAKKLLCIAFISTLGLTGCNKFLDVNENPNNPDEAEPSLLLPTVEAGLSQVVGNSFQIYGNFWAQYWTQNPTSSQYRSIDQYRVLNTAVDRSWSILYRSALNNAELIINSDVAGSEYYKGIAYILKAYGFQLATDAFGDVPLSEALKGKDFVNPNYEGQEVVYDSIFTFIDKGKALFKATSATGVSSQDMIFGGDLTQWEAFANTLALRAYLRLSEVDATKAAAGIKTLYAENAKFLTNDASITYTTTGGNENPLYNEMVGLGKTQNMVASSTAVTAFTKNNDPRLLAFYDIPLDSVHVVAIPQGSYASNTKVMASSPSALVGASANNERSALAPAKLISKTESLFLQSEAAVRGWGEGDAEALYQAGVEASFLAAGLSAVDASTYLGQSAVAFPANGTAAKKIESIITQKYYAMCGFQGFEAWTEWRRTGYPTFFVESAANTLGEGRMPLRLPYANSEITSNANFPGALSIDKPVWWDVN